MTDPFIKPSPGDRFHPSADAFRAMLEAGQQARAKATSSRNVPHAPGAQVPAVVMRATCGELCEVGDVVSVVGSTPEFGESESLDDRAKLQPVLVVERGAKGNKYYASQPWGVVVRPIPADGVGSVCVAGVAAAKVQFYMSSDTPGEDQSVDDALFCSPMTISQDGPSTVLQARHDGEVKILTKGPYLDGGFHAWCHVLLSQHGNRGPWGGLSTTDEWLEWYYIVPTAEYPHGSVDIRHNGPVLHETDPTTVTWVTDASAAAGILTLYRGSGVFDRRGHLTSVNSASEIEIDIDALADLSGDDEWIEVTGDVEDGYVVSHIGPSDQTSTYTPISGASASGNQITINIDTLGSDARGHVTGAGAGTPIVITLNDVLTDLTITGDPWIGVTGSATAGYVLSHEGPSYESANTDTVSSVSLVGTLLTVTGVEVGWDAKGHVTGDGAGIGQSVDLASLVGALAIGADDVWIEFVDDGTGGKVINHIGPDANVTVVPSIDDVTLAGTVLSITPVDVSYDAKGHVYAIDIATPLEVDLQDLLGELDIDGDGTWIEVTGDYTTGYTINHIGPSTATSNEATLTIDVTGNVLTITPGAIDYDEKGHVVSVTPGSPIEFTDHDEKVAVQGGDTPGYLFAKLSEENAWIELTNNTSDVGIGHADPQAEAGSYETVAASYIAPTLTITPRTVSVDAKGHVRSITAGDAINLNLTAVLAELVIIGDGAWIAVSGDYNTGFVVGHIGPSSTEYTITIDQVDHSQADEVTFDEKGHFNGADDDTVTIYDRLVRATGSDTSSGYLIDKLENSTWIKAASSSSGTKVILTHELAPDIMTNAGGATPPGAGANWKAWFSGDDWLHFPTLKNALIFDIMGHLVFNGDGTSLGQLDDEPNAPIQIEHADPQTTLRTLTIGGESITIDAKGHVNNDADWSVDVPTNIGDLDDVDDTAPSHGDLLRWNDSAGAWEPVSPVDVTVLTDYRVDGANKKLQKKTRTIKVIEAGTESGWIDVHTGADCP